MHQLLKKSVLISEQLLQLLEDKNWDEMNKLTTQRMESLSQYFLFSPLPDNNETITRELKKIQHIDDIIKRKVAQEKKSSIQDGLNLKAAAHAINQYTNHNA